MATITRRGQTQLRQMESTEQGIVAKSGMYPSLTVTCIWMAWNVEERSVPKTDELCTMCSKDYTADDFINCEKELLICLDFRLIFPTSKLFVRRMLDVIDPQGDLVEVTSFFCDISLIPRVVVRTSRLKIERRLIRSL